MCIIIDIVVIFGQLSLISIGKSYLKKLKLYIKGWGIIYLSILGLNQTVLILPA